MVTKTKTKKKVQKKISAKASMLRQLSGAVIGGSLALVSYYAYDFGSPVISAWLLSTPSIAEVSDNTFAKDDLSKYDKRMVESQVRRIAQTTVPTVVQSSMPSSEFSSESNQNEIADSIWVQEWKENSLSDSQDVAATNIASTEIEEYLPETAVEQSDVMEEQILKENAVYNQEVSEVPKLPDSGFGILALMVVAGAGAGVKMQKRKGKREKEK